MQEWRDNAVLRRCLNNAAYSSADYLLLPVLWVLATPLFVSRLGTEHYGIWMTVNSVLGVGGLASYGLANATIKYVAKYRARGDDAGIVRVLRSTLTLYTFLGAVAGLCVCASAPLLAKRVFKIAAEDVTVAVGALRLAGAGLLVRFLFSTCESGLFGFERHDLAARVAMITNGTGTLLNMWLVWRGKGVLVVISVMLVMYLVGAVTMAVLLKRCLLPSMVFHPCTDRAALREVVGFAAYTWVQSIVGSITQNLDNFLVVSFIGPSALTFYSVSKRLAAMAHGVLTKGSAFLFPLSGTVFEQRDEKRLRAIYDHATRVIVVLATSMQLPICVLASSIFVVWRMGDTFAEVASPPLQIMCFAYALSPLSIINYHYLLGTGHVRLQTAITLVAAPVYLVTLWLLTATYGVLGAAWAQCMVLPISIVGRTLVNRRLFGGSGIATTLGYLVPIAIPFAAALLFVRHVGITTDSLVSLGLYGAALAVAGGATAYGLTLLIPRRQLEPSGQ